MNILLRLTVLFIALAFSSLNISLLLRKRISERSTILWLFGTLMAIVIALFPQLLNGLADHIGVDYPPALLYLVAILVLLSIVMHQSIQLSRMDKKLRQIGQAVSLMGYDIERVSTVPMEFFQAVAVGKEPIDVYASGSTFLNDKGQE